MPSASEETPELDSADLVEENELVLREPSSPERGPAPGADRPKALAGVAAAAPAEAPVKKRSGPHSATLPEADTLIAEGRRRAQLSGQFGDRVALARSRTELAILLEVLKTDPAGALAEYRAAHAMAPASLAPISAARRLTALRPIAPALSLLEAELRGTADPKTRAVRLLELGRMLLAGGAAPEKTVQAFRDSLAIVENDPAALRGLERALRSLPRALENPATLELLAAHLDAMSSAFRRDVHLAAWLQVERASILERLRKPEAARAALEVGLELEGGLGPVRDAYTRHLLAHDNVVLLVDAWSTEAALEGDNPRAARLLYAAARLASERLTKPSLAIELHRRAIALASAAPATRLAALRELERLHTEAGDTAQAVAADRELLSWVQGAELTYRHRRLAQASEKLAAWEQVAVHAQEVLAREPDDDETRERLDRAWAALAQHQQRISFWTAEASRTGATAARVDALVRSARIAQHELRRPELALSELRAAWAIDPENAEIADAIAELLTPGAAPNPADPDDPSRARARIDFYTEAAAKALDVGRKVAHLEKLAQIWEDEVRAPDKAMETYREILAVEAGRQSAILGLERCAARAGDPRTLFRALVLEADLARDPSLVRSLLLRAAEIASARLGDADTALELVERVVQKSPGDPAALRAACRIHQRTGRYEEAAAQLKLLLQHTRRGPASFAVAVELAALLEQRLRRRDEALAAYRDAFRNDPTHPLPRAEIRRILFATGDHRAAADELIALSGAAADHPTRGRLLLEAAEIYGDRLNETEKSVALLGQARAFLPGDVEIKERLERAHLRQGKTGELAVLLDAGRTTTADNFTLGWLLSEDRDWVRATRLLEAVLAQDPNHVPAQRALEHALARTEQWAAQGAVLRAQARTFETREARLGALGELIYLEDYRGVTPLDGAPPAVELIRRIAPTDLLAHEAVLKHGFAARSSMALIGLIDSLEVVAASTPDAHHAAALQLVAALMLEGAAQEHDEQLQHEALGRYRVVLEGWPECLTAARGIRRLADRLQEDDAFVEACTALGTLAIEPRERAERLVEAAERLVAKGPATGRAEMLYARALGENPDSATAATGLVALAKSCSDAGQVADALRRALERTTVAEQAVRLGAGLATLAFDKLKDPTVGLEALRRVRKRAPGHVATLLRLAEASHRLDLYAEAAESAESALGITRDAEERVHALLLLASAHAKVPESRTEALREAEQAEKAAEVAPLSVRARWLCRLSDLYLSLAQRPAAERTVINALVFAGGARVNSTATEPDSNLPLEALARLFPPSTREGAIAYCRTIDEAMRKAKALSVPSDPSWLAAIGKVEAAHLGQPREGLAKIREAIALDPGRVESYAALCEMYAAMGSSEEAVDDLLAILPKGTARPVPLGKMLPVLELFVRTCQLAGRKAQAVAARQVVTYLSGAGAANPSSSGSPAAMSLAKPVLASLLGPVEAHQPWLDLSAVLAELAPKALRIDLTSLGVSSRARLSARAAHPLRALCDDLAPAFGDHKFDLLVDVGAIGIPRVLSTDPPLLVLPRGYADLPGSEQAAGIGRLLAYLALDAFWLDDLGADDLHGWFYGAMRVGDEGWQRGQLSAAQDANADVWRGRIGRVIGRRQKRALEELAARPVRAAAPPEAFRSAVRAASLRAAFLVTGDLASTLNHLSRIDRELSQLSRAALPEQLFAQPAARDLIFFSLTREALALRKSVTAPSS